MTSGRRIGAENYELLKELPESAYDRAGNHTERGRITLREMVEGWAAHAESHARQLQEIREEEPTQARIRLRTDKLLCVDSNQAVLPMPPEGAYCNTVELRTIGVAMQRDLEGSSVRGNAGFDQRIGQALLALYSPAVIVVARELEVLACRGDFARLFGADPPDASAEWLTSASTGAGAAVRRLVGLSARTAARQTEVVSLPDHPGRDAGRCVRITAVPDSGSPAGAVFVLVFESMEPPARAGHVENELSAARLYLQTVIDDYEANTEELRSAHEELQAANEELLKTNEELGTSQHELESLNRRLRDSNGELTRANRDLVTLLDSIELPVLMLDSDLRVRRFNASSRALFNVLPSDVGRPIADLRPKLPIPGLEAACREVLQDLAPWERQVRDGDGRVAVLSIRAYRGSGNLIEGVVLTLTPRRNVRNLSGAA